MMLLHKIFARGLSVLYEDGNLIVSPSNLIDDDIREFIRLNKSKLIAEILDKKEKDLRHCHTCKNLKKPGKSSGYCGGGRDDLPGAYGINHPLRKLPFDLGLSCEKWIDDAYF